VKVGDLVKVEYRFDWIKFGVITALRRGRAKIHWNDGEVSVTNTLSLEVGGLEVISASR